MKKYPRHNIIDKRAALEESRNKLKKQMVIKIKVGIYKYTLFNLSASKINSGSLNKIAADVRFLFPNSPSKPSILE